MTVLHNAVTSNAVARIPAKTRAQQITGVIDRLPEHLRPSKGSFEDLFSRACAEIALSATLDENGNAAVPHSALVYLAKLLCGRGLPSGDCHDACRLQHQCVGSSRLVLASFGAQARACLEALGLQVVSDQGSLSGQIVHRRAQPLRLGLQKVGSAA